MRAKTLLKLVLAWAVCGGAVAAETRAPGGEPKTLKSIAKTLGDYPEIGAWSGARWYYNWSREPGTHAPPGMEFVPMIWGAPKNPDGSLNAPLLKRQIQEALERNPGCKNLLGFNEPDHKNQSNMTVARALEAWPLLQEALAGTTIRLGSPGVVGIADSTWLEAFMAEAQKRNYQVDFICVHKRVSFDYLDRSPAKVVERLARDCKTLYAKYKKPIWITELELVGKLTEDDVIATWQAWADCLENDPAMEGIVERYALAYAPPDTTIDYKVPARPLDEKGQLTAFGRAFQQLHEPRKR